MQVKFVATYRIQLRSGIGFEQVVKTLAYLKELGISHLYFSPYFQAMPGSAHGYDVVDPTSVDSELGGEKSHAALCQKLQELQLGHVIDIVPNHMAISKGENPWWWDVLENGSSSRYATFFDVDWDFSGDRWPNKVLLPVLGDQYGRVLANKQLTLSHFEGLFILHYENQLFPIDPSSLGELLNRASLASDSEVLAFLAESCDRLPKPEPTNTKLTTVRDRDRRVILDMLTHLCQTDPKVRKAIDDEVAICNEDLELLHSLIERQNYRLSFWKTANRDLGYRRFFDIKDLAGIRVEDPEVFSVLHALPLAWIKKGWVQGLRIDHPDGLRYPTEYFQKLRGVCPDTWIVAEKILTPPEELLRDWPINGTTGYDFIQLVGALFVDPSGKDALTALYQEITKEDKSFQNVVLECKNVVLTQILESELDRLTTLFIHICEKHRLYRDYTRRDLREAFVAVATCFPVYRSYVSPIAPTKNDPSIEFAVHKAMEARPDLDSQLFELLKSILTLQERGQLEVELAMRFQQLTVSVMAKGCEDTAFYRYNRFVALNEVGGNPDSFGITLEAFYEQCRSREQQWPLSLLTTTTHDTKRSGDVRARLSLLSEIPGKWAASCLKWFSHNSKYHIGEYPDSNMEYLFYQTLLGAWPISKERMHAYMEKAIREAKAFTSWTAPNDEYEQAVFHFINEVMQDEEFLKNFEGFVRDLILPGRINSLTQQLMKFMVPGVPDIYQGSEIWDLTLVDPDNRQAVDFERLYQLLKQMKNLTPQQIMDEMDLGLPKLWVVYNCLAVQKEGAFRPLYAIGKKKEHVVAFARGENAIAIAPRLIMGLDGGWEDTSITLPEGVWNNVLAQVKLSGNIMLKDLLALFPVALLVKEE
jgi:(1->4)-alpha-D-glucan 1-alpha-D-glucosylmutase